MKIFDSTTWSAWRNVHNIEKSVREVLGNRGSHSKLRSLTELEVKNGESTILSEMLHSRGTPSKTMVDK